MSAHKATCNKTGQPSSYCTCHDDIMVSDHGSIVILTGLTVTGREWLSAHLPDDAQTWGIHGYVVEPRYVNDIMDGAAADGLEVGS